MRSGAEVPDTAAMLVEVESGVIVEIDFYLDQAQARGDAGLD